MEALAAFADSAIFKFIVALLVAAGPLAAFTPSKYDNIILQFLRDVLDKFAWNFGNAKNVK